MYRTLVDTMLRAGKEADKRGAWRLGTPIWDFEWDICCVLDGCRLDLLNEYYACSDTYRSVAATSQQWLPRTFEGRDCSTVAYVTGNPYAPRLDTDAFGYFAHVGVQQLPEYGIETVPPGVVADRAIAVWRRRDELGIERLVVHFMQPHVPFRSRPEWFADFYGTDTWGSDVWAAVGEDIEPEEWWEAYRDNLFWVIEGGIDPIRHNADALLGVTADHGNAMGEGGFTGHPEGCYHPIVRRVPWAPVVGEDQHTREPELEPFENTWDTQRQLEALGYA